MPEGDTVLRTARRLDEALTGAPLRHWDLRWGVAATSDLTGRSTFAVVSRGKHLLHRVEGGFTLHSHLRMEGRWEVFATGALDRRSLAGHRVRAVVGTDAWTCVGRSLGLVDLLRTAEEARVVGHLGPDLLGPDWDPAEARRRLLAQPGRAVAAALLDQRNLAGIGTFYCAETLFLERIDPWTPIVDLALHHLAAVVERAHRLLGAGALLAAPSTTGLRRRGEESYVHGRTGRPCRRCGDVIRTGSVGDPPRARVLPFCPTCQADPPDRRRVRPARSRRP